MADEPFAFRINPHPGSVVVSFDIDGTIEDGDPPGPITVDVIRRCQAAGYVIGSASDRTVSDQTSLWARRDVVPDFVSLKHRLPNVAAAYPGRRLIHIGDTDMDAFFAAQGGFEFVLCTELPVGGTEGWIL
jgi:hypothetical protein